jgi:thioredoxin-like negative regulator of GroEL
MKSLEQKQFLQKEVRFIKYRFDFGTKGKTEEAKKAVSDARLANQEDTSLILTEANLYLETKDFDTYKKLVAQVLEKIQMMPI